MGSIVPAFLAKHGRHVQNRTALLAKSLRESLATEVGPLQVNGHHAIPIGRIQMIKIDPMGHTREIHQNLNAARIRQNLLCHSLHRGLIRHVHRDAQRIAAKLADRRRGFLRGRSIHIRNDNGSPLARKSQSDRPGDTAACSSHYRPLTLQQHDHLQGKNSGCILSV